MKLKISGALVILLATFGVWVYYAPLPEYEVAAPPVRPGSDVEKIRDAILNAGKPLHISEIILALGRSDDAGTKAKIAGLLGWYTSKGKVFTKTDPNTYGLVESAPLELPAEFGAEEEPA